MTANGDFLPVYLYFMFSLFPLFLLPAHKLTGVRTEAIDSQTLLISKFPTSNACCSICLPLRDKAIQKYRVYIYSPIESAAAAFCCVSVAFS